MAAVTAYDPSAGGPSADALLKQTMASDVQTTHNDLGQMNTGISRNTAQYNDVAMPQLQSSMGAAGQYYGTAARSAESQQLLGVHNQNADLKSAFGRAQDDMARQQAFAAMGIIL
jgi:hypothetical protein